MSFAILDAPPCYRFTGFNVGINAGASAAQTVFHVHVHLIPSEMVMSLILGVECVGLSQISRGINLQLYLL